tara:strand:- start:550 stop:1266 length:717 start_codon:yes stop_codon:yes gene_type:complete
MKKILITGGRGRFATHLYNYSRELGYKVLNPSKEEMDIRYTESIDKYFKENNSDFDYVIHTAAITTPMSQHKKKVNLSIQTNIIGTGNIVMSCRDYGKKLIYISTNYVYPGIEGNYDESSNLKPINEYAWSKLGGECSVHLYKNSLILRICMNKNPFPHKKALTDVISSHMFNDDAAKITLKLLNEYGIINVGGKAQSVYDFVKEYDSSIGKITREEVTDVDMCIDGSMNIEKMKSLL